MKFFVTVLLILLLACAGGGAYFYMYIHTPMMIEYQKMIQGMPELAKARAELKKYKEREAAESAWIPSSAETFRSALANEITAGKAEVETSGNRIIVNIAEDTLYQPGSKVFSKGSPIMLTKIASLLKTKDLEGREIIIGNTTPSVAASGKGRKRRPARNGRALAGERSQELVKYLEKNGVNAVSLTAAAYAPKMADKGFKIKERKTILIISSMPAPGQQATVQKPAAAVLPQQAKQPGTVATPSPGQSAPAAIPQQAVPAPAGTAPHGAPSMPQPAAPQQIQTRPVPAQSKGN